MGQKSLSVFTYMAPRKKTPMTDEHKAALAAGREQGAAVRRYLDALDANRPKRGRKRTPDSINKRIAAIDEKMKSANSLARLQLTQERSDLQDELESMKSATTVDLSSLERDFVRAAAGYGSRKGIAYSTWRSAGVPADVLKRAGISRGARD